MKRWIGKAVILIGIIHLTFGFVVFHSEWAEMVRRGFFNTVAGQADHNAAFWFIAFGALVLIFGALINWCEKTVGRLPGFLGWSLLILSVAGIVMIPVSGWWLLVVPAFGAIRQSRTGRVGVQN